MRKCGALAARPAAPRSLVTSSVCAAAITAPHAFLMVFLRKGTFHATSSPRSLMPGPVTRSAWTTSSPVSPFLRSRKAGRGDQARWRQASGARGGRLAGGSQTRHRGDDRVLQGRSLHRPPGQQARHCPCRLRSADRGQGGERGGLLRHDVIDAEARETTAIRLQHGDRRRQPPPEAPRWRGSVIRNLAA